MVRGTSEKILTRLEEQTPSGRANAQAEQFLRPALRVACNDAALFNRLSSTLEWRDLSEPLPAHLTEKGVQFELNHRLGVFIPLMIDEAGRDAVSVFMTLLAYPTLLEGLRNGGTTGGQR